MTEISLKIDGMFCPHCEERISKALMKLDGAEQTSVSYKNGCAKLIYDSGKLSYDEIKQAVENEGYTIREGKRFNSQSVYIMIIIAAAYVILRQLGALDIFRIFPDITAGLSYGMLFVIGLLTSVHCIAMCGGINLMHSVNSAQSGGVLKPNLLYNLGRVVSYTVIGSIVGAVGSVISLGGSFRGIVAVIAGVFMIIMGMNMLGLFRVLHIHIPVKAAIFINRFKRGQSSFVIGLLNGLMPCGPLQSMQLYALYTGSIAGGAVSMLLFSAGTVPLMLLFGTVSGKLNRKFASKLLAVSAALVVILGIGMVVSGLNLSGLNLHMPASRSVNTAVVSGGYQLVQTEVDYGSYEPITVKRGIPVRWTIVVPDGKLNGCNNEIIIPEYEIE